MAISLNVLVLVASLIGTVVAVFMARRNQWPWKKLLANVSPFVAIGALAVARFYPGPAVIPVAAVVVSLIALATWAHFIWRALSATENRIRSLEETGRSDDVAVGTPREAREERRALQRRVAAVGILAPLVPLAAGWAVGDVALGGIVAVGMVIFMGAFAGYVFRPIQRSPGTS